MARSKEEDAARKKAARDKSALGNWHSTYKHMNDAQVAGLSPQQKKAYTNALTIASNDPESAAEMRERASVQQSGEMERVSSLIRNQVNLVQESKERRENETPRGSRTYADTQHSYPTTATVSINGVPTVVDRREAGTRYRNIMREQARAAGMPNMQLPKDPITTGEADLDPHEGARARSYWLRGSAPTKYLTEYDRQAHQVNKALAAQDPSSPSTNPPTKITGKEAALADLRATTEDYVRSDLMGERTSRVVNRPVEKGGGPAQPRRRTPLTVRGGANPTDPRPVQGEWVERDVPDPSSSAYRSLKFKATPPSARREKYREETADMTSALKAKRAQGGKGSKTATPESADAEAAAAARGKRDFGLYSGVDNSNVSERRYILLGEKGDTPVPTVKGKVFEFSGEDALRTREPHTAPQRRVVQGMPQTTRSTIIHEWNPEESQPRKLAVTDFVKDAEGKRVPVTDAEGKPLRKITKDERLGGYMYQRETVGSADDPFSRELKPGGDPDKAYIAYRHDVTYPSSLSVVNARRKGLPDPLPVSRRTRLGYGRLARPTGPLNDPDSPANIRKATSQLGSSVDWLANMDTNQKHEYFLKEHNGDEAAAAQALDTHLQHHARWTRDARLKNREINPFSIMSMRDPYNNPNHPIYQEGSSKYNPHFKWDPSMVPDVNTMHVTDTSKLPAPVVVHQPSISTSARANLAANGGFASSAERRANDMRRQASLDQFSEEDRAVVIARDPEGHAAHQQRMAGYAAADASTQAAAAQREADKTAARARLEASYPAQPVRKPAPSTMDWADEFSNAYSRRNRLRGRADDANFLSSGQFSEDTKVPELTPDEEIGYNDNGRSDEGYAADYWD